MIKMDCQHTSARSDSNPKLEIIKPTRELHEAARPSRYGRSLYNQTSHMSVVKMVQSGARTEERVVDEVEQCRRVEVGILRGLGRKQALFSACMHQHKRETAARAKEASTYPSGRCCQSAC